MPSAEQRSSSATRLALGTLPGLPSPSDNPGIYFEVLPGVEGDSLGPADLVMIAAGFLTRMHRPTREYQTSIQTLQCLLSLVVITDNGSW
jgi:hypothetical protein